MLDVNKLWELMEEKEVKNYYTLSKETNIPYSTLLYMIEGHDMQVSTIIELSRFFNVPMDYLVNKPYRILTVTQEKLVFLNTSSLLEAAVSSTL